MLTTIIVFIIILGLLVLVHELGHFVAARRFGVKCEEFGLGFPPRLIGVVKSNEGKWQLVKRKDKNQKGEDQEYKNVIYSLNWVPLGGFVKIKGEDGGDREDKDSFSHQPIWRRTLMIASGVSMNFVLAVVLLSVGFAIGIPQVIDHDLENYINVRDEKIQILSVQGGSPAAKGDLEVGDIILSIDGQPLANIREVESYIKDSETDELVFKIRRGREQYQKIIKPTRLSFDGEPSRRAVGIAFAKTGIVSYPFFQAIWQGIITTLYLMKLIILSFYNLFLDLILGRGVTVEVAGPVGIAVVTGQVVKLGFIYILQFAALLSINLGIINFFPFPALDGGRVIALGVEAVRQKPNNQKIESLVHNIGFGILMVLVALVTYRDVVRAGGKVLGKFFG